MIIVTGGAGFIGSALVWQLNEAGLNNIVVVDRLGQGEKWRNLTKRHIDFVLHKDKLFTWLEQEQPEVTAVFHMGACSSTTETDADYLMDNNVLYSIKLFQYCAKRQIPFIYASSAATYGAREANFTDDPATIPELRPINKYGYSKQLFDVWALKQSQKPPFWAGLKFFNVYGPQEYHKGGQASVVFHAFPQVRDRGMLKLFKSYKEGIASGDQQRDFVYVKDVVAVLHHLLVQKDKVASGIYNLGTGKARTFADLGRAVFQALKRAPADFDWIEMPDALRNQYQYFTEADLTNLRERAGYQKPFTPLEEGVADYVQNYLMKVDPYL